MKSRKFPYCIVGGALCVTAFICCAWYYGFVPVADGPDRARLRHALNLTLLPASVSITAAGHESWTDYIFEAEIRLNPDQATDLMRGRAFRKQGSFLAGGVTAAVRISGYTGFEIDEHWSWEDRSSALSPSVVSHKRLDLFSFVFAHSRLSAAGLDLLQRLLAAA